MTVSSVRVLSASPSPLGLVACIQWFGCLYSMSTLEIVQVSGLEENLCQEALAGALSPCFSLHP